MIRKLAALVASVALIGAAPAPKYAPIGPGYQPQDQDERGLWLQAEEYEKQMALSNFVIRDAAFNAYVRRVFCDLVGQAECAPIRIYIVRTPYFNASMAPNGMMQIWSGLFLRARNEAQMAAVLGHEYVHYQNRHSLQSFRDIKAKTGAMAWLGFLPFGFVAQIGVAGSIFSFNRDMEREADTQSIALLAKQGYNPTAASAIWEQLRAEQDATAAARNRKSKKDKNGGLFATHPPTDERMAVLKQMGQNAKVTTPDNREWAYRAALSSHVASFIDDQIKLNDFGGTEFLIAALATSGWTPELHYMRAELYRARGRPEDFGVAATSYRAAVATPGAPVEAWRGLGLALLRSGAPAEGKAALSTYLEKYPAAGDRAMIAMLAGG